MKFLLPNCFDENKLENKNFIIYLTEYLHSHKLGRNYFHSLKSHDILLYVSSSPFFYSSLYSTRTHASASHIHCFELVLFKSASLVTFTTAD